MKNFEELSSLWVAQPEAEHVPADIILKQVKKNITSLNNRLLLSILLMAAAFVFMIVLFLFFLFNSWFTYAGIFIVMSTVSIYAVLMLRDYRLLAAHDPTVNVNQYLENLKKYQTSRARMYGRMYYVYSVLISLGLGLFMIEVLRPVSVYLEFLAYAVTMGWILYATFYLREPIIKAEQQKISEIIGRLERLKKEFTD